MKRETRETWAKRVGQWAKSGLSGGEFATQLGVKEGTLRHWKWQLGRKQTKPSVTPAFFEVVPVASVAEASCISVEVGRARVGVPVGFDETTLRRLMLMAMLGAATTGSHDHRDDHAVPEPGREAGHARCRCSTSSSQKPSEDDQPLDE